MRCYKTNHTKHLYVVCYRTDVRREQLLAGALLAVAVGTVLAAVVFPGALADRSEPAPDGDIQMEEIAISATDVGGERLGLATDVRLAHGEGVSENVTVELRAIDTSSGLVEATQVVPVGGVDQRGELSATATLRVERGGDYEIEAVVFQNGIRETTGSKRVSGTEALTPGYPENPVEFYRFANHDLPTIEYQIAESVGNETTLDVGTYVTNGGETTADELTLVFQARQVDSGIVAAEQEVDVASVGPSQTARPEAELTVPTEYNYYLDSVLYRDGVIVDTARAGATLNPTEVVPDNQTEEETDLDVGDFEPDDDERDEDDDAASGGDPGDADGSADDGGPGFGLAGALLAVVLSIGLRAKFHGGNQ